MVIYSRKKIKKPIFEKKTIEEPAIVKEEVKITNNEIIRKPKKKKTTPVIEPAVEDIKIIEDEDLSKWLEEHTED